MTLSCVGLTRVNEHTVPIEMTVRTEKTTRLHYDGVVCEKRIAEGGFGVVFKGKFELNDVAVKQMKEIGATEESLDEFANDVAIRDKFRCVQIVHFSGECTIPNNIMMVTEFALCVSIAESINELREYDHRKNEADTGDGERGT